MRTSKPLTYEQNNTVEMHQQPGDRSCSNEAIGGAHYGPVLVYMASVADASSAEGGDAAWFKVFQDTWASNGTSGSDDNWGTKDLNTCCGMMDVLIPEDIAPGDYLLRAEAIALHTAGSEGGAQFYSMSHHLNPSVFVSRPLFSGSCDTNHLPRAVTCYQITVTGSGSASPETVSIPGAYAADDAGILINIYQSMSTYEAPGPTVYAGGSTKSAGAPCANCESTCTAGSGSTGVASSGAAAATTGTSAATSTLASSSAEATTTAAASSSVAASSSSSSSSVAAAAAATTTSEAVVAAASTTSSSSSSSYAAASPSSSAASTAAKSCNKRRSRIARNL